MTYEIEDGVPIPAVLGRRQLAFPGLREALATMEVGQSVLVEDGDRPTTVLRSLLQTYWPLGRKFATRAEGLGLRVWRIS